MTTDESALNAAVAPLAPLTVVLSVVKSVTVWKTVSPETVMDVHADALRLGPPNGTFECSVTRTVLDAQGNDDV